MKEGFDTIFVTVAGKTLAALINGDRGWLMYMEYEGDAGSSSRNPSYIGPASAVIEYYLDNGQRDEYPAAWAYPIAEVKRALDHFRRDGTRPPFIEWHRD